jgi:putative sterol carrier protein
MSDDNNTTDLTGIDPSQAADAVANVTPEQLAEGMRSEMRGPILDQVFAQMREHIKSDAAASTDAVVHWKIGGRGDGGEDHYEVVIRGGTCEVNEQPKEEPTVTLTMDGADFLRLVTNNANGPELFMSGKLKIEGDLAFASTLPALFTIPKASPPPAA